MPEKGKKSIAVPGDVKDRAKIAAAQAKTTIESWTADAIEAKLKGVSKGVSAIKNSQSGLKPGTSHIIESSQIQELHTFHELIRDSAKNIVRVLDEAERTVLGGGAAVPDEAASPRGKRTRKGGKGTEAQAS